MPRRKPGDMDKRIGRRIRQRRKTLKMSMAALGALIGVEHQQIQKYEVAKNRVPASLLWEISERLDKPVAWFFK